jgi:hypothetical protein
LALGAERLYLRWSLAPTVVARRTRSSSRADGAPGSGGRAVARQHHSWSWISAEDDVRGHRGASHASVAGRGARLVTLLVVAAFVAACAAQKSTVQVMPVPNPPSDPCKIGLTHLGAFTERLTGDVVALRSLLVAPLFDNVAAAKAIRVASATLEAYPELQPNLGKCPTTSDLAKRVVTLEGTAETIIAPSLATWISDDQIHWEAAYGMVGLLPEVLALSRAAKLAADPLNIEVIVAVDPDGAHPPVLPAGPFAGYNGFSARILDRGSAFLTMVTEEESSLFHGGAGEVRRVGRRIMTFSDTEIGWLKSHPAAPCYAAFWRATLGAWTDMKAAGTWFVAGSTSSAAKAFDRARNHLTTLLDRNYIADADLRCVVAPVTAP